MRRFTYVEPGEDGVTPVYYTVSDDYILEEYFPYWLSKMKEVGRDPGIITHAVLDRCIDDFCVVHWATEVRADA